MCARGRRHAGERHRLRRPRWKAPRVSTPRQRAPCRHGVLPASAGPIPRKPVLAKLLKDSDADVRLARRGRTHCHRTKAVTTFTKEDWMKVLLLRCLAVGAAGFCRGDCPLSSGDSVPAISPPFPVGTLVINLTGSLFLGWFLTYAGSRNLSDMVKLSIGVGFVGAYTTFSTYMYESNKTGGRRLGESRRW